MRVIIAVFKGFYRLNIYCGHFSQPKKLLKFSDKKIIVFFLFFPSVKWTTKNATESIWICRCLSIFGQILHTTDVTEDTTLAHCCCHRRIQFPWDAKRNVVCCWLLFVLPLSIDSCHFTLGCRSSVRMQDAHTHVWNQNGLAIKKNSIF